MPWPKGFMAKLPGNFHSYPIYPKYKGAVEGAAGLPSFGVLTILWGEKTPWLFPDHLGVAESAAASWNAPPHTK